MSIFIPLAIRALTLVGVVLVVLLLVVITLGATGFSDKTLTAVISEELRGIRAGLAQTIRDPDELEAVLRVRREELESFYDLDRPWYYRLPTTARQVLTMDLGEARTLRTTKGSPRVIDLVRERIPVTMALITTATIITGVVGLFLGVKLSTRVGTKLDRGVSFISAASFAAPAWWTGIILILVFVFHFRIFPTPSGGLYSIPPPEGTFSRLLDLAWNALLPIITLVLVSLGGWIYVVRTMVLNTSQEFFVTVARAKGLSENRVMWRYIIRVAAVPIVTHMILGLQASLGGAILTETVFNWPGMGRLTYEAVIAADESVIIALTFVFTLLYVGARFLLEVLYLILDPRIRYTEYAT